MAELNSSNRPKENEEGPCLEGEEGQLELDSHRHDFELLKCTYADDLVPNNLFAIGSLCTRNQVRAFGRCMNVKT
jgi:hypothetical protein